MAENTANKVQVLYTHNNEYLRIIETIEIYSSSFATTAVLILLSKQPILTFLLLFQVIIFDMNYLVNFPYMYKMHKCILIYLAVDLDTV